MSKERDYYVAICEACRTASCWHGEFMCWKSGSANVIDVLASDLRKEDREHPSYFAVDRLLEICGHVRYAP